MSMKYEDVLRELELLPAWQLRQPAQVAPEDAVAISEQDEPPLEHITEGANTAHQSTIDWDKMDWVQLQSHLIGTGDPHAAWLFIGDPASDLDIQQQQAFAGEPGALLDKMLAAIQLKRGENIYLAHLPNPLALSRLVALLQPKLIVTLGQQASQALINSQQALEALRGKKHQYQSIPVIASYAPSHLLQHEADKRNAWKDLCAARDAMAALAN